MSVVIATYQRRDVVCDAVAALCRAPYGGERELIVVIDGSTDGTAGALAAIDCPFAIRIVEQPNRGASAARNHGASLARNEVILFLDDDMIAQPDLLDQHAALYREGADAVIGDTPIDAASPAGFLADSVDRWITSTRVRSPLSPFDIFTGQLSVRRSVFEELGGFDSAFTTGAMFGNEDADFGVGLLARFGVRHNPAAISHQRYVVSPREYMERAARSASADLRFIRKHPELARQLFERKGMERPLVKWLYLPLARIPLLPAAIAGSAVRVAELALATRFKSNRLIARFFSGARSLAYWSALRANGWLPFSDKLLILCYHAIADQSDDPVLAPYGVPPRLFANHLDSLTKRGFTFVTPAQFAAFFQSQAPLPRRPVLLTFDDGYADLMDAARDVLQPRGIEAVTFIVTGAASGTNEWDRSYGAHTVKLLTPGERQELASVGVEIGSHSRTHREMRLLSAREQMVEAQGSADDLATGGLPCPRFFAYPFGAVDDGSKHAVEKAGFSYAFGLAQRRVSRRSDRFDLPRVIVLSSDRGWRFRAKTAAPRLAGNVAWLRRRLANRLRRFGRRARDSH